MTQTEQFEYMTDKGFEAFEKQAEREFRDFKRRFKKKYPHLYNACVAHEKENDEKDVLFVDIFSSRFANEVQ